MSSEFLAWSSLRGERLTGWELDALDMMDVERLLFLHRDHPSGDTVSSREMSPELFDALF